MDYQQASYRLMDLGVSLTRMGNQYRVNYRADFLAGDHAKREETARYFTDLGEAFRHGTLIANDVLYGKTPR